MEGYKTLKAGQSVSFDVIEGPKGLHAANIVPISDENKPASKPQAAAAPAAEAAKQNDQVDAGDEDADDSSAAAS